MSIFRYNFNLIQNSDIKRYLHSKMDSEKWEESLAVDATFAHFRYFSKISYGFPMAPNHFVIMKKFLKKYSENYELPFIFFDKKNEKEILQKNIEFIEQNCLYYLRNGEGKRDFFNYNLTSISDVNKIIIDKYKDTTNNVEFVLEKSTKNLLLFQGNSFEFRTYVLIVQIDKKIYTFLYPLLIAHFGVENINISEFLQFLDIEYQDNPNILSCHPLLDKIYQLVKNSTAVISNVVKLTNHIYKIENSNKYKNSKKPQMQYHLYALDIIFNKDKQPFLLDIVHNPIYNISKEESKTIREKNKMINDIIENFVVNFTKFNAINYDNRRFILLTEGTQYFEFKLIISKKINDDLNNFEGNIDILSKDGEKFLIKCLNEKNMDEFNTDNSNFVKKIKNDDEKISITIKKESNVENDDCIFEHKNDDITIDKKIEDLLRKEKKEKIIGIASATLPIFFASYLVKKTYQSFTKKN